MRLCTFEVDSRFGAVERIGVQTPGGRILDLHLAYTLTLAERQQHPRPYEQADVLVPPDMFDFLTNGQSGRDAVNDALTHLESRVDDPDQTGLDGEQLAYGMDEIKLLAPLPRDRDDPADALGRSGVRRSGGGRAVAGDRIRVRPGRGGLGAVCRRQPGRVDYRPAPH